MAIVVNIYLYCFVKFFELKVFGKLNNFFIYFVSLKKYISQSLLNILKKIKYSKLAHGSYTCAFVMMTY